MKKSYLIFMSLVAAVACTGCDTPSAPSTPSTPSTPTSTPSSWTGKTNEDFPLAKTTYMSGTTEKELNMNTLYRNSGAPHLDPLKDQNVLVIPFGFADTTLESVQTQETINRIETTFFGEPGDVDSDGWFSVKTFYDTSSYGKQTFKGKVLPNWCIYNNTASNFAKANYGGVQAAEYARNWYVSEYSKENHGALGADAEPLTYFDQDKDGFIDLIWLVYSHPIVQDTNWWAYVTYTSNSSNINKPSVKTLGWASIGFMDKGFGGYDAHTFIHETGHTYGLDDYYDYTGSWSPMGGIDFMDHNLGDHCMFSKFTLGWTSPLIVDDTALITLRPGTTTGDCFIIPSPNYNGTAFDEYIMVELMSPVGLAEFDYKNGYENTNGYSQPGLRITHVDARPRKTTFDEENTLNPETGKDFRVCNTKGGRSGVGQDGDYWEHTVNGKKEKEYYTLTSLMESDYDADKTWKSVSTFNASNRTLFKKNHVFSLEEGEGWAETFMPSRSNLWNKAKFNTERAGSTIKKFTVDETCTFNYEIQVVSIKQDAEYGYVAEVKIIADKY